MNLSFSIGRWLGVPVRLHISWLPIFLLAWYGISAAFFPTSFPGWSVGWYALAGFVTSVLFWASVLGHELAHALVARARGVPIRRITLLALGGAAEMERDAEKGSDEAIITIVGPLSSLLFAGIFFVIGLVFKDSLPVVGAIGEYLALINLSLALFNIIPAFPLDGGRVLRAVLWRATKDFIQATRISVRIGQIFAWLFIIAGLAQTLLFSRYENLWIVFIGWYLQNAAQQTLQQANTQELLRGVRAGQIMRADFGWVPAGTIVQDLVHNYFLQTGRPGLPVIDNGCFVGLVTMTDIKHLAQTQWPNTPVAQVMTPYDKLVTVGINDSAETVLRAIQEKQLSQIPVLDQGRLVGMIAVADILQVLKNRRELGLRNMPRPTQPTPGAPA